MRVASRSCVVTVRFRLWHKALTYWCGERLGREPTAKHSREQTTNAQFRGTVFKNNIPIHRFGLHVAYWLLTESSTDVGRRESQGAIADLA